MGITSHFDGSNKIEILPIACHFCYQDRSTESQIPIRTENFNSTSTQIPHQIAGV